MVPSAYIGTDSEGNYRCLSWLVLDENRVIQTATGMRSQSFQAVCETELVSMLAMFDIYEKLKITLNGKADFSTQRASFFRNDLPKFKEKYEMASSFTCGATV
jgi:hypothetical protein